METWGGGEGGGGMREERGRWGMGCFPASHTCN